MTVTALNNDWPADQVGFYTKIAFDVGGQWLSAMMFVAACLSAVGQFLTEMASDSYNLMAMGEDGMLPKVFAIKSPATGAPWLAVLCSYLVIMVLITCPFAAILEIDNWLGIISLLLQYAAFIQLRIARPDMPRPFKACDSLPGAVALIAVPSVVGLILLSFFCDFSTHLTGIITIIIGIGLYFVLIKLRVKSSCPVIMCKFVKYRLTLLCALDRNTTSWSSTHTYRLWTGHPPKRQNSRFWKGSHTVPARLLRPSNSPP